jgi:hypothetical protein
VGEYAGQQLWFKRSARQFSRNAHSRGIDEEYSCGLTERDRQFRRELMASDDFNVGQIQLRQFIRCVPGQPIITAQWIAVRDDKNPGHGEFKGEQVPR